jgi:hypothetical protein
VRVRERRFWVKGRGLFFTSFVSTDYYVRRDKEVRIGGWIRLWA